MTILLALTLLHGVVMRGPTQPVCQVGKPCSAPAVGAVLEFVHGSSVATVRAGTGGRYSIRLAPGRYLVRVKPAPKIGSGIRPLDVNVPHLATVRIDFTIDTGIR
jgi:hypothetical protein